MKRLASIAVAATFVACGGTTIDGGALEDEITKDASDRGLVLDAVDCPSPDAEEGASFTCVVTVKGQETEFEVVQSDDDGNVTYDFTGLAEGPAVNATAADEASVRSVIESVNGDVTAICDYATREFRNEIARGENCAKVVLAEYDEPLKGYAISIDGDDAAVVAGSRAVNLKRQKNGSWLITNIK